jgi:hypothetical protein
MNSLPVLASVISLVVQALKALIQDRLPDEVYPVFALILGVGLSFALKGTVLEGINIGLASMGIYAVAKHAALGVNKVFPN